MAKTPQAIVAKSAPKKQAAKPKAGKETAKPAADTAAPAPVDTSNEPSLSEINSVAAGASHRPIPGVFKLMWRAIMLMKKGWRVLLGLALVYMLLNLLLVQGLNVTSNLSIVKESLGAYDDGVRGTLTDGVSLYTRLLGATGTNIAPTAGAYQFILGLVFSLAAIWALRQIYADREIRIRDTFYYGMYPFITFFLVLLMVAVHLAPFALGSLLYGIITSNGIATNAFEAMSFLFVFLSLSMITLYLLASSLLALYIVTLPEVTPMAALRSARDLVVHRRWTVMRKVLFMPFVLLVVGGVVLIPVVLWLTPVAPWIFTALAAVLLIYTHAYMYTLYRSLL
jgi:hypothetical protein